MCTPQNQGQIDECVNAAKFLQKTVTDYQTAIKKYGVDLQAWQIRYTAYNTELEHQKQLLDRGRYAPAKQIWTPDNQLYDCSTHYTKYWAWPWSNETTYYCQNSNAAEEHRRCRAVGYKDQFGHDYCICGECPDASSSKHPYRYNTAFSTYQKDYDKWINDHAAEATWIANNKPLEPEIIPITAAFQCQVCTACMNIEGNIAEKGDINANVNQAIQCSQNLKLSVPPTPAPAPASAPGPSMPMQRVESPPADYSMIYILIFIFIVFVSILAYQYLPLAGISLLG
jgi:hypothetical protein